MHNGVEMFKSEKIQANKSQATIDKTAKMTYWPEKKKIHTECGTTGHCFQHSLLFAYLVMIGGIWVKCQPLPFLKYILDTQ